MYFRDMYRYASSFYLRYINFFSFLSYVRIPSKIWPNLIPTLQVINVPCKLLVHEN